MTLINRTGSIFNIYFSLKCVQIYPASNQSRYCISPLNLLLLKHTCLRSQKLTKSPIFREPTSIPGVASGKKEIPHIQAKERWLRFDGAGMKRYPTSKVRETPVRWQVLREGIRRQTDWNHNQRKLTNLITQTTALSNSMKLSHAMWGHPRRTSHGGEVWENVVHWRREWQTTSVFLPWEPHEQYEKAKR